MKKCIGMILVAAMLMLTGAAFAEGPGGNMGGIPPDAGRTSAGKSAADEWPGPE